MGVTDWKELTSKKGAPFKVGKEGTTGPKTMQLEVPASGNDFGIGVEWVWTPGQSSPLKTIHDDKRTKSGIKGYKLCDSRQSGYKYDLYFEAEWGGSECYFFHDDNGDSYEYDTTDPGIYILSFNSKSEKADIRILYVSGSAE